MNRAFMFVLLGVFSAIFITGCNTLSSVSGGDKFSESFIKQNLIVHKTTKSEVVGLYGQPDSTSDYSDGESTYLYAKHSYREDLNSLYELANTIPGASSVQNAIGQARGKTYDVDQANKSVNKLSGNKAQDDQKSLRITFDKKDVVSSWSH